MQMLKLIARQEATQDAYGYYSDARFLARLATMRAHSVSIGENRAEHRKIDRFSSQFQEAFQKLLEEEAERQIASAEASIRDLAVRIRNEG